jgi:hypothetical protein
MAALYPTGPAGSYTTPWDTISFRTFGSSEGHNFAVLVKKTPQPDDV